MITFRNWYISLSVAALLICSRVTPAEVKLHQTLSLDTLQPGEEATLEIKLPTTALADLSPSEIGSLLKVNDSLLLQTPNLMVLRKELKLEDDYLTWTFGLTSYEPGTTSIPPIEINIGPYNFSTELTTLTIASTRTAQDTALRPNFEALSLPFELPSWFWSAVIGLFVLSVVAGVLWHYRHYFTLLRRPLPAPRPAPVRPPEHELAWLKRQLKKLKTKVQSKDAEDYTLLVDELTHIIRKYMTKRCHVPAEAWTTKEFIKHLTKDQQGPDLGAVLRGCDTYRFQGEPLESPEFLSTSIENVERAASL